MSPRALALASLAALGATAVQAATYPIVEKHSGATFFNGFTFYDNYDNTTSGDVVFVNSSATPALAYVNDAGHAIVKVSTDEVIYNEKRNSVKITTESAYDVGTVWVFDAVHMPVGCSQWPAFWTTSPDWPVGGEIDILEGVNLQTKGQYAVHTVEGCKLTAETSQLTGTIGATDCNATTNAGCTVFDSNTNSYGEGFNSNGGGVWVSELAEDAISIWFIARPDVPSSLTADAQSIDTSTLGTPTAYYPASGCNGPLSDYIHTQQAIIDITLCGVWAGTDATLSQYGCEVPAAPQTCYTTYVLNSTNYENAYFEISYLNIYSTGSDVSSVSTNPTSTLSKSINPSATGTQTNAAAASASASSPTSGALGRVSSSWVGAGVLAALGVWTLF